MSTHEIGIFTVLKKSLALRVCTKRGTNWTLLAPKVPITFPPILLPPTGPVRPRILDPCVVHLLLDRPHEPGELLARHLGLGHLVVGSELGEMTLVFEAAFLRLVVGWVFELE